MVRQLVRKLLCTFFVTNNRASFHLGWKENLVKQQKVPQYYFHDYSYRYPNPDEWRGWIVFKQDGLAVVSSIENWKKNQVFFNVCMLYFLCRKPMHWLNEHGLILVREVLLFEPWRYRQRSVERENVWKSINEALNAMEQPYLKSMNVLPEID